jgi:hypothetical protein
VTTQASYGVGEGFGEENLAAPHGRPCDSTASVSNSATVMVLSRSFLERAMDEDGELMEAVQAEIQMKEYILSARFLRQVRAPTCQAIQQ